WCVRSRHSDCAALGVAEGEAQYHFADQGAGTVPILDDCIEKVLDSAAIAVLKAAAKCVAEDLAGHLADKLVLLLEQGVAQFDRPVEFPAGRELARGVDLFAIDIVVAPAAHPVKVFEPEADRVHQSMAR